MPVAAFVALHADRAHIGEQHDRALPDLLVEAGEGEFGAHDGIRFPQQLEALLINGADDANTEAGARKRLAPDNDFRQAELASDRPHLVFEEGAQRFNKFELQVCWQAADVVVAFDIGSAGASTGFDNIRVKGALHQEAHWVTLGLKLFDQVDLRLLEGADELAPDDLALGLRIADTGERLQKLLLGVDGDEADAGGGHVVLFDLATLVLAQQTVVDEHAAELVADRFVHECRGNR